MSLKEKAVALLSGGLDSTVALAEALEHYEIVRVLTFNYGQRAYGKEISASRRIADYYKVPHEVIALPWLATMLPRAMSFRKETLVAKVAHSWENRQGMGDAFFDAKPVWVPNRNGLFLNIAACYAEAQGANTIIFGANAEEAERFPDNTEEFRQQINAALAFSTLNQAHVVCPVGHLEKPQIVDRAKALNIPLQLIWSCYCDTAVQCGECPSCYRLKQALTHAEFGHHYQDRLRFVK